MSYYKEVEKHSMVGKGGSCSLKKRKILRSQNVNVVDCQLEVLPLQFEHMADSVETKYKSVHQK